MTQAVPSTETLPEGWMCPLNNYSEEDEEWFALFEYPEYSLTVAVVPPSVEDNTTSHTVYSIYPFYEDIGLPSTYTHITTTFERNYLREQLPHHPSDRAVSTKRSTVETFDWEDYPVEYRDNSTFYQNYPLQYKDIFTDIDAWPELANLAETYPQCFDDDQYITELYLNRSGKSNELFVHSGIALHDSIRDFISSIFDLPSVEDYEYTIDDRTEIGEVAISIEEVRTNNSQLPISRVSIGEEFVDLVAAETDWISQDEYFE